MKEKVMEAHYDDIVKLTDLLKKLVDSYRLLIGGAAELNTISERRTKEVNRAIDRADAVGDIIDDLVKVIDACQHGYLKYSKLKNEIITDSYDSSTLKDELKGVILTEINHELNFFNNSSYGGNNAGDNIEDREEEEQ